MNFYKCKIKKYKQNNIIYLQDETCFTMDMILQGQVSIQKIDRDGNILRVHNATEKSILGASLIFASKNTYPMTVVSKSNTLILKMHKEFILKLGQKNIDFMSKLMAAISDKNLILTDKIKSVSLKSIREKIIDFLKDQSYLQGSKIIELPTSKKDLAENFGIQRTSLSRELNKMRQEGLIEYDAKTIMIKNI